jgi:cobalt/nickel transport system permease protein
VGAGTSGHLIGAALATVLLGPAAAVVAMTAVLLLQCLMFADGGVTALGANLLNLAIVAPLVAHAVHRLVQRLAGDSLRSTLLAAGFAAWCATVAAAVACAIELAASGVVAWRTVLVAMGSVHMVIGLAEGAITMLILVVVARSRPELLVTGVPERPALARRRIAAPVAAALGGLVLLAPFASSLPDGLERVAEHLGFAGRSASTMLAAPLPDYSVLSLAEQLPWLSTVIAGASGCAIAFAFAWLVARALATPAGRPAGR